MITLNWYEQTFHGAKAVRGDHSVTLYDDNYNIVTQIYNIYGNEWEHISIQNGDWSDPEEIPTEMDRLRADLDYCMMLLEE